MKVVDNSNFDFENLSRAQKKAHVHAVQKSSQYQDKKLLNLYRSHENSLLWMSLFSMLIILQSGLLPVFTYLCLLAPIISWWQLKKEIKHFVLSGSIISSAGFIWAISKIVFSGISYAVLAATIALLSILTGRILSRENSTHDIQIVLLSFALCLASTVLTPSLMFVPFFILFSIFSILALTTRQLIKGFEESSGEKTAKRKHQALISWKFLLSIVFVSQTVLAFSVVIFLFFPRIGGDGFKFSGESSFHFPDAVDLSASPWGRSQSNEIVARVEGISLDDFVRGLYLRGGVYEKLTTQGFSKRPDRLLLGTKSLKLSSAGVKKKYQIILEPFAERTLFSLGDVHGIWPLDDQKIDDDFRIYEDPQGALKANIQLNSKFKYEVFGQIRSASTFSFTKEEKETDIDAGNVRGVLEISEESDLLLVEKVRTEKEMKIEISKQIQEEKQKTLLKNDGRSAVFYELPHNFSPKVAELAKKFSADARTAEEVASSIRDTLIREYTYTKNFSSEGSSDAIGDFLLKSKAGHCEYFATAFALMMRSQGFATRVIGGFQGGVLEPSSGDILFKQKNAHAWVEWYHPTRGWLIEDPTPTPELERLGALEQIALNIQEFWDNHVVNFSISEQILALRGLLSFWKDYRDQILLSILGLLLASILIFLLYSRLREKRVRSRNQIVDVFLTIVRTTLDMNISLHMSNRELLENLRESELLVADQYTKIQQILYYHERLKFGGRPENKTELKKRYQILLRILEEVKTLKASKSVDKS